MKKRVVDEKRRVVFDLKRRGLSNREIGRIVGISPSTVHAILHSSFRYDFSESAVGRDCGLFPESGGLRLPRLLFLDIEVMPSVAFVFGPFQRRISPDVVIDHNLYILCAGLAFDSNPPVVLRLEGREFREKDDRQLVSRVLAAIQSADVVVGHNLIGFDWKVLLARVVYHGFPMPHRAKLVDTLKLARRGGVGFFSKSLDSLGKYLLNDGKQDIDMVSIWKQMLFGNYEEAIETLASYTEKDVELLRSLYNRLAPLQKTPVSAQMIAGIDDYVCPVCFSLNVKETGRFVTENRLLYKELQCASCGYVGRTREAEPPPGGAFL